MREQYDPTKAYSVRASPDVKARYQAAQATKSTRKTFQKIMDQTDAPPEEVARMVRENAQGDPRFAESLHNQVMEYVFPSGKGARGAAAQKKLLDPRFRDTYIALLGEDNYRDMMKLSMILRQAEWDQLGKAGAEMGTQSAQLGNFAESGVDWIRALQGRPEYIPRVIGRTLNYLLGRSGAQKLYNLAYRDLDVAEALLSFEKMDPDTWMEHMASLAARRGIVAAPLLAGEEQ